jgi:hypothetical protein
LGEKLNSRFEYENRINEYYHRNNSANIASPMCIPTIIKESPRQTPIMSSVYAMTMHSRQADSNQLNNNLANICIGVNQNSGETTPDNTSNFSLSKQLPQK